MSINIQIQFHSPKTLGNHLKSLAITNKHWSLLARAFENNPNSITLNEGKFQTLDRAVTIEKTELSKKPHYCCLVSFFLSLLKGRKHRQRMDNLAAGLLALMQKSGETEPLINKKVELVLPTKHTASKIQEPLQNAYEAFVRVRPVEELRLHEATKSQEVSEEEAQAISQLTQQGLLLLNGYEQQILSLQFTYEQLKEIRFKEGFNNDLFWKYKQEIEGLLHHQQQLKNQVESPSRTKQELEASIRNFNHATRNIALIQKGFEQINKEYANFQASQRQRTFSAAQKTRPLNTPNRSQGIFSKDDPVDRLINSLGFGSLNIPYIQNLLSFIDRNLKYVGLEGGKVHCLDKVLHTIGLGTVGDCQRKGVVNASTLRHYLHANRLKFKNLILQKHGNVIKEIAY